jgi:putative heme transporter
VNPIPEQIKLASEWSWRVLVIAAGVGACLLVVLRLELLFGVVFAALVATAILLPLRRLLERLGWHRGLATVGTIVIGLLALSLVFSLIAHALEGQADSISNSVTHGVDQARNWLRTGPLKLTDNKLDQYISQFSDSIKSNKATIVSGVAGATSTAFELVSGLLLTLFTTIFFLHDGEKIWHWLVNLLPSSAHTGVHEAGELSWTTFTGYVRGTAIIAFVDATTIGIGIALTGVPLALPLAVFIFFGAFVPIVGALVSGFVAVAVALATHGFGDALIVLLIILAVQQLEGHILQPLVMGHSVHLHPLAIVLTVTAGSVLGGIPGAIVAVPIAAITNTSVGYYGRRARADGSGQKRKVDAESNHQAAKHSGPVADKPD